MTFKLKGLKFFVRRVKKQVNIQIKI